MKRSRIVDENKAKAITTKNVVCVPQSYNCKLIFFM